MSTTTTKYVYLQVNGPISIVPITAEQMELEGKTAQIYILMGPTGSGKSSFIESLVPDQQLNISKDSLESVTQNVTCYQVVNLGFKPGYVDRFFVLMDTPGFLDPRLSEGRITRMITDSLNTFRQHNIAFTVFILYFQSITDIRIGGSKRDAVNILRQYVKQYNAQYTTIITTMWNTLGTPKQLEDAKSRLDTLENEIYTSSSGLVIKVTMFDTSQASALSLLEKFYAGWGHDNVDPDRAIDPPYQSLLCNNLLGRIASALQQLQLLAEHKWHATHSGSQDQGLLEVVRRDETLALASLQSFLDDLGSDIIGPSGTMALQFLLDTRYEQDPAMCSSRWMLSQASPLAPSIPLPADATPQPTVASNIPSARNPTPASPSQVPGLHLLSITPAPIPSAPPHQPPSPDPSCFAPIAVAIKRQFNRTRR